MSNGNKILHWVYNTKVRCFLGPYPPPLVLVQRDNQTEKQKEKKVTYIAALSPKYHYRITEMAHFSFQVGGRGGGRDADVETRQ